MTKLISHFYDSQFWGVSNRLNKIPVEPPEYKNTTSFKRFDQTFNQVTEAISNSPHSQNLCPTIHITNKSKLKIEEETLQLIVIDVDASQVEWSRDEFVLGLLGNNNSYLELSKNNGLHFFGYVNSELSPKTNKRLEIDSGVCEIKVNGACMFTGNEYDDSKPVGRIDNLLTAILFKLEQTPKKETKELTYKESFIDFLIKNTVPSPLTDALEDPDYDKDDIGLNIGFEDAKEESGQAYIINLLTNFPAYKHDPDLYDRYYLWFSVGAHIKHHLDNQIGLAYFSKYSQKSKHFDPKECESQWNNLNSKYRTHDYLKKHLPQVKFKNKLELIDILKLILAISFLRA